MAAGGGLTHLVGVPLADGDDEVQPAESDVPPEGAVHGLPGPHYLADTAARRGWGGGL